MFTLLINTNIPNVLRKYLFLVYNKYLPIERNYNTNSIVLHNDLFRFLNLCGFKGKLQRINH